MDDPATFRIILTNAIGLAQARQRNAVIDNGFDTCEELLQTPSDRLSNLWKSIADLNIGLPQNQVIKITLVIQSRLNVLRKELRMRRNCDADMHILTLQSLVVRDIKALVTKHNQWQLVIDAGAANNLPSIDVPKLTASNWKEWRTVFTNSLTRIRGLNHIAFSYIIRHDDVGDYQAAYSTTHEQLIACMTFTNQNTIDDLGTVYSLLEQHLKGSYLEATVERYRNTKNGRDAWKAILAQVETSSYNNRLTIEATKKLSTANYRGELANFGIDKYYAVHTTCHNLLKEANTPMAGTMKFITFNNGIKDNNTAMYVDIVSESNPATITFEEWYTKFINMLKPHLDLTAKPSGRNISEIQTGGNDGGPGGRGRGQGRGRGRFNGRGGGRNGGRGFNGRGRGRNNNRYHPYNNAGGFAIKTDGYSATEWAKLTDDQRKEVKEYRVFKKRNINQTNTEGGDDNDQSNDGGGNHNANEDQIVPYEGSENGRTAQQGRAGDVFAPRNNGRNQS